MKKLLGIMLLGLILFSESAIAKRTKWSKGQIYEGEIYWNNKLKVTLPSGKFELVERYQWSAWGLEAKQVYLANLKGKLLNYYFSIGEVGSWTYQSDVRQLIYEWLYQDKYDGCYKRSEYTLVIKKYKGAFHNCLVVGHSELQRDIYTPDDPQNNHLNILKLWIKKNNIELPSIMLCNISYFMAPTLSNNLFLVSYCINPELNGASKTKFTTEETTEYHPSNIHQYPDKKKYMENFIKLSAQQHKLFEKGLGAKERHKLDLSEYGVGEIIEETKTINITSGSGISDEIKELNKLYEEGVLTKEEFEKAKKKVLSQ